MFLRDAERSISVSNLIEEKRSDTHISDPGSPFATEMGAIGLTVDLRAPFVYVANIGSNSVSIYSINRETEALTLAGSLATRNEPFSVAITGR